MGWRRPSTDRPATYAGPLSISRPLQPAWRRLPWLKLAALGPRYGHDDLGAGRRVLVEYSSPNMARRLHIGHIRSTIIGQALANSLRRAVSGAAGRWHPAQAIDLYRRLGFTLVAEIGMYNLAPLAPPTEADSTRL